MLLYIHIPFCDSKCHYCAFNSYVDKTNLIESYMQALLLQLSFELEMHTIKPHQIETLFFGGGTPSCVDPRYYEPLFELLKPYLAPHAEITTEANPNSATDAWLRGMYTLGCNRISFGVQSFDPKKLKLLNRAHTREQAIEALTTAASIGFKNISLDLIYATAIDTKSLLLEDLKIALGLPINHLSAYALAIEEGTLFEKKPKMASEDLTLTQLLFDTIAAHGFEQYEISNFGTSKSKHNLGYWEYKEYLGAGSGAVGRVKNSRYYPHKDLESYIKEPHAKKIEHLTQEEMRQERIFLGLRSCVGVDFDLLLPKEQKRAAILIEANKLFLKHNQLYNYNYLLADEVALFLGHH